MKVLVTGNAGFIGFHVAKALLQRGDEVTGVDAVNDYYDPALKQARLDILAKASKEAGAVYRFIRANLADSHCLNRNFSTGVNASTPLLVALTYISARSDERAISCLES